MPFFYSPEVILLDDIFKYLKADELKFLAKIFNKYKDKVVFVCMTNNLEVPTYFSNVDLSILDKGKIVKRRGYTNCSK